MKRKKGLFDLLRYRPGNLKKSCPEMERFLRDVNQRDSHYRTLGPEELLAVTAQFRQRLHENINDPALVVETFALIREQAGRTLGMRHYDVQLAGGRVILNGSIAEMSTGEGKTLTASLPATFGALAGIPVHIITANDYLAQRDAELMRPLYQAQKLSVGAIQSAMSGPERKEIYSRNIVYCSNKEIVFDYLKDRLILRKKSAEHVKLSLHNFFGDTAWLDSLRLRGLHFAIVDEADCIFIDEARTPLILSQEGDCGLAKECYATILSLAKSLQENHDFYLSQKTRTIDLTDRGRKTITSFIDQDPSLFPHRATTEFLFEKALAALKLFKNGREYIVTEGADRQIAIVDEQTGRVMQGRSWEMGLQQFVEVKEDCRLTGQPETLLKINFQNFFNRYHHLAGMTGTAREVSRELWDTYRLQVVTLPANGPVKSKNLGYHLYLTREEKNQAIIKKIASLHRAKRPVLIGTTSVSASEELAALLAKNGFHYKLLNARQDKQEAEIIAQAGIPGQITIATNMAGRGTDIVLQADSAERGGLYVLATECANPQRIDRQLFGRCGRQGDPGSYETFFSLEDPLFSSQNLGKRARIIAYCLVYLRIPNRYWSKSLIWLVQKGIERHYYHLRNQLQKQDSARERALSFSSYQE